MVRGKKLEELRKQVRRGVRVDSRKHTRHCLRPPADAVQRYLASPSDEAWQEFEAAYLAAVEIRFASDPSPFDTLAERAAGEDVFLGCNCPTAKNPNPKHCHTYPALRFMKAKYPKLKVDPGSSG